MRIKGSTLVEFVLALAIVGTCFSVAAVIFSRSNRSTIQFKEAMDQTEFQSVLFEQYITDTIVEELQWNKRETSVETQLSKGQDRKIVRTFILRSNEKLLWQQDYYQNVEK